MANTKMAWKKIVSAQDLDSHMLEIGQAEANGRILNHLLGAHPIRKGAKIYVPGCGTGQQFEFFAPEFLKQHEFLVCDFSPDFISEFNRRHERKFRFRAVVDDVEESRITDKAGAAIVVLLLEHVEWKKALGNILKTEPDRLYCIIQLQKEKSASLVSKGRKLRPTIGRFVEEATPELVPPQALESCLASHGYHLEGSQEEQVPDGKAMLGMVFARSSL